MKLDKIRRKKILLVDNSEIILTLLTRMLHKQGHDVKTAEDGLAALEVLGFTVHTAVDGQEAVAKVLRQDIEFCAVVMDITMPGMDGIQAMQEIRKIAPGIPILLSSGASEDDFSFKDEVNSKPDGFLQKPFQLAGIRSNLEMLLA